MATKKHKRKQRERRKCRLDKLAQRDQVQRQRLHAGRPLEADESLDAQSGGSTLVASVDLASPTDRNSLSTGAEGRQPIRPDAVPGVRGLLEDERRYESDLALIRRYMGCANFTEDEVSGYMRKIGEIISNTERDTTAISAFRTMLMQADLAFKMRQQINFPGSAAMQQQLRIGMRPVAPKEDEVVVNEQRPAILEEQHPTREIAKKQAIWDLIVDMQSFQGQAEHEDLREL